MSAPLVTVLAVGLGVATSGFGSPSSPTAATSSLGAASDASRAALSDASDPAARTLGTSRSSARVPLVNNRVPVAKGKLWSTAPLDLRLEPREKARTAGLVKPGTRVAITGRRQGGYAEVIVNKTARWVTDDYLSKDKVPEAMAVSNAPCPDGSGIEGGLQPAAVRTYRAVCNAFPELSAYGGQDGHGEHVNGQAIDFMVPSSSVGQRVADYLFAHRAEFDLFDIIWSQHIWTIERSGEGFRSMSDRGSATANHYDHVHIMVN
ncbi:MAG: SH3 domain-containing protein [Marmoricola sp.]